MTFQWPYTSASRLKTLSECKKYFHAKYIAQGIEEEEDSPYAVLGSALHEALEDWRKNPTTRKDLVALYDSKFTLGRKHRLYIEGIVICQELNLKDIVRGQLVETEKEFEFEWQGHKIKAVIDKIELLEDGSYLITDYKSNKEIKAEEYIHQLALYDIAMETVYPNSARTHELYYLRHSKSVPFKFTEANLVTMHDMLTKTEKLINENADNLSAWPKLPKEAPKCKYCVLSQSCWGKK